MKFLRICILLLWMFLNCMWLVSMLHCVQIVLGNIWMSIFIGWAACNFVFFKFTKLYKRFYKHEFWEF